MSDKQTTNVSAVSGFTLQIILLVLWYTVAPGLPWWLVFLPAIIIGVLLAVSMVCLAIAGISELAKRR